MPKNKSINLLPQEEFDVSILGRTLKWAMGTFRIIVIVTEMVVMGAFLSRFWLDAQNSDLADSIKVKGAQITAQADLEKKFRSIQSKINIAKQTRDTTPRSQIIEKVISKLPAGVTLTGLSILDNTTQIKGNSTSEFAVAQFVSNLKSDTFFKSVDLGQISSSDAISSQIGFLLKVTY